MALRVSHVALLCVPVLPFVQFSCGGGESRSFVAPDSGSGGSGTGGTAGSSVGGSAGAATGGTAGAATGGTGGGADSGPPCTGNAECDDGNSCNGTETCDAGACIGGTPQADGTSCTLPVVGDGGAGDAGTAEYVCVAQVCSLKCTSDEECNDNDVCTGNEICSPTTQTCQSGTPPNCDDNDACTTNECDPITGCFNPLIDADSDGHAAESLGACGTDCDDNDDTVHAGAAELCDSKDNDCNGTTDEGAPTWYADCDKDTYAPTGAQSAANLCTAPATAPVCDPGVTGGWTNKPPVVGSADCWDKDADGHPMTVQESETAWSTTPMANVPPTNIDFDFNCDGSEEKRYTNTFVSTSASCQQCGFAGSGGIGGIGGFSGIDDPAAAGTGGVGGTFLLCCGTNGWTGSSPACGASATYTSCIKSGSSCTRVSGNKIQECR